MTRTERLEFEGASGNMLSAKMDFPNGTPRAYALFAHCYTCSKDLHATSKISRQLATQGIAVLRFDFTGLGQSEGEFAATNFSSNQHDLIAAVNFLKENYEAPSLIIGHSLGGAAVLSVAGNIPEIKAVATIGAPSIAEHVVHNFGAKLDEITDKGEAEVELAGRVFKIRKQFLEDLRNNVVLEKVREMKTPLMVLHSPIDETVGIENATEIFVAAKHPKSFVSLDNADHLVSSNQDADFIANVIAAWSSKYLPSNAENTATAISGGATIVEETSVGKFQNKVTFGNHSIFADEPKSVGGLDTGPSPYDLLAAALGACTNMTLRMYADFKKLDLGKVSVVVDHAKIHAKDCEDCAQDLVAKGGKVDLFKRTISVENLTDETLKAKVLEIADKCPVHRTLEKGGKVSTVLDEAL